MNSQIFLLYLATWSLVALSPGPAVMCSMSFATRYGLRHAFVGILGIQAGHVVFFACTAFGLAALLAAATTAFTVLRVAGAAYLVYLGVRAIIATFRRRKAAQQPSEFPARRNLFLQGLAIQVTNPKALLFMSALLPQFIHPQQSLWLQLSILLPATIAVDVIVLTSYAAFAARGAHSFRESRFSVRLERVFGAALILFGIRLLSSRK